MVLDKLAGLASNTPSDVAEKQVVYGISTSHIAGALFDFV